MCNEKVSLYCVPQVLFVVKVNELYLEKNHSSDSEGLTSIADVTSLLLLNHFTIKLVKGSRGL